MNGNTKKVKEIRLCLTEMVCGHGPGKFRHSAQISDVLLPSCSMTIAATQMTKQL